MPTIFSNNLRVLLSERHLVLEFGSRFENREESVESTACAVEVRVVLPAEITQKLIEAIHDVQNKVVAQAD